MHNLAGTAISPTPISAPRKKLQSYYYFFAFICFILHQFGPSYHLSFGSLGLLLLVLLLHSKIRTSSLIISIAAVSAIFISYSVHIINYGDDGGLLRIGRFAFNAFVLFLLLDKQNYLPTPSAKLVLISTSSLLTFAIYQNFYDPSLRMPAAWFALSADIDQAGDFYLATKETLRASGPYSEPSVLGMVFCCLYAFGLRLESKYRKFSSLLCTFGVLLSGSLLGLVGLGALYFSSIQNRKIGIKKILIGAPALAILAFALVSLTGYGLAFLDRTYEESQWFDVSTQARLIKPFSLILEIFSDYNFLGFPGDIYTQYLSTGIYDSQGNFPGHNGFLGLIMSFGLFGAWFIWLAFNQALSLEEGMLLLLIGSQSGNFLSYEKIFLMIFVILSTRGTRNSIGLASGSQSSRRGYSS